ncbi:MAG: DUF3987 domain-containing protein, partial [Pedobacter sp.]
MTQDITTNKLQTSPIIWDSVYDALPDFLKACTCHFSDERERDVVLTSCLSVLSVILSDAAGTYSNERVGPNLFTMIVAPAASGKGVMKYAQYLGAAIHNEMVKENKLLKKKFEDDMLVWRSQVKQNKDEVKPSPDKPRY